MNWNNKSKATMARGFSLIEVMAASVISASVLTAAALVFNAIGQNQRRLSTFGAVEIGSAAANNYYNLPGSTVDSYDAPSYGRAATADLLRERFWEDISHASAVYCLGRSGLNTIRPLFIPVPADGRTLDSPEAFRLHLASVDSQSASVYQNWRGSSPHDNGSIYILQPSGFAEFLAVRAIYDIDVQTTSTPPGTYVSVKRYSLSTLTDYYDIFYPDGANGAPFKPLFAFHERRARLKHSEGNIDNYKTAADMPFYNIWWPDPASPSLAPSGVLSTSSYSSIPTGAANPLPNYSNVGGYATMAGRTNYYFTVPLLPSQL